MEGKRSGLPWAKGKNYGAVVSLDPAAIAEEEDNDLAFRERLRVICPPDSSMSAEEIKEYSSVDCYGGALVCESCSKADAEFIVRACNAHEELLAVVERIYRTLRVMADQDLDPSHCNGFVHVEDNVVLLSACRDVLLKVKGELPL